MKAVFLSYNQALTDRVNAILDEQGLVITFMVHIPAK